MAQSDLTQPGGKEEKTSLDKTSLEFAERIMNGHVVGLLTDRPREEPQSALQRLMEYESRRSNRSSTIRSLFLPRRSNVRPCEIASRSAGHQEEKVEANEEITSHVVEGQERQHSAGQVEAGNESARTADESRLAASTSSEVSGSHGDLLGPRTQTVRNIDELFPVPTRPSAPKTQNPRGRRILQPSPDTTQAPR